MNAIEAMIYCLGFVNDTPEDGYIKSQTVYDRDGEAHWFAWHIVDLRRATPEPCSETPTPFARNLAPYRMSREGQ